MSENDTTGSPSRWLIRIPEIFAPFTDEILRGLGATSEKSFGREYHLVQASDPEVFRKSKAAKYLGWNLPIHHAWPCVPQKMENFIEKAAQGIFKKFGEAKPQTILTGALISTAPHPYYRHLATNLRGRTLQLFPTLPAAGVDDQRPAIPSLFCLVGKEGLYCGLQSPRDSNGFYPGGTKFISQGNSAISRAGAKIAEALHYLQLYRPPLAANAHWLELGASPGGMTSELLNRDYRVTAVDRAAMDSRIVNHKNLDFVRDDVLSYLPPHGTEFDAILCDMNGDGRDSLRSVVRLARHLKPKGLVVFTLKMLAVTTLREADELFSAVVAYAEKSGLNLIAQTHLTYNRFELTLFFEAADVKRS
ncbi:MAG: hypothetical protein JWO82_1112 [Akkermansiaceae bacterium]|nr:hypothetical protein [Akkermansiaceae bacterium]